MTPRGVGSPSGRACPAQLWPTGPALPDEVSTPLLLLVPFMCCQSASQRAGGKGPGALVPTLEKNGQGGEEGVRGSCPGDRLRGPLVSHPEVTEQVLGTRVGALSAGHSAPWGPSLPWCLGGLVWGTEAWQPAEGRWHHVWDGPAGCWATALRKRGLEPGLLLRLCTGLCPGEWGRFSYLPQNLMCHV